MATEHDLQLNATQETSPITGLEADSDLPEDERARCCKVNTQLLPVKGFYFMIHTALATVQPYLMVYLKQQGLSASESGVLFGSMPFLSFLAQPLVGAAADRWLKHKAVIVSATLATGLFHLLFLAVSPRPSPLAQNVLVGEARLTCLADRAPSLSVCSSDVLDDGTLTLPPCLKLNSDNRNRGDNTDCSDSQGQSSDPRNQDLPCPRNVLHVLRWISQSADNISSIFVCQMRCSNDHMNTCFQKVTDENTHRSCNETGVVHLLSEGVQLLNISELHVNNKTSNANNSDHGFCKVFNIVSFSSNTSTFENALCNTERTFVCQLHCELSSEPQNMCETNWHPFDVTFGVIFVILFFGYLTQTPITSMADAAVYCILKDKRELFGRQRLWGSMGYLTASAAVFAGIYFMNQKNDKLNYTIMFSAYAVLCAITALVAGCIQIPPGVSCGNMLKNARKLLTVPKVVCFVLVMFYFGFMLGAIIAFLFWYLLDLGAPTYLFGLARFFCVLCEIPVFTFSGRLVEKFGPAPVLCIAMVTMSTRLLAYSLLGNPWLVLLVEPLHGVTFCLMFTAATTYASLVSPPGMTATTQGMVGGMLWGLGRGSGALVTGVMFSALGARVTYGLYAGVGLVVLLLYALLHRFVFTEHSTSSGLPEMMGMSKTDDRRQDHETETQLPLVEDHLDKTSKTENGLQVNSKFVHAPSNHEDDDVVEV